MRKALVLGVATKIYIEKLTRFGVYTKERLLEELKGDLNLELYNVFEDMEYVILIPKNKVFVKYIAELLSSEVSQMRLGHVPKKEMKEFLENLKELTDIKDFKKILLSSPGGYFLYLHGRSDEDISYIYSGSKNINIFADMIGFCYCNSVYIECYRTLFRYLLKKIKKTSQNPLKDDIFFLIKSFDDYGREISFR